MTFVVQRKTNPCIKGTGIRDVESILIGSKSDTIRNLESIVEDGQVS
jgi:hypothetical protein